MKRAMPWSDEEDDSSSSESSSLDMDTKSDDGLGKKKARDGTKAGQPSKEKTSAVRPAKQKSGRVGFEALTRHGYKGGLSVLSVPLPKEVADKKQDWSWSTGKESGAASKEIEESYEERQKTRAAIVEGEQLTNVLTRKEKNLSFAQKEKRKRDLGQASRGKNYVEEEKRLLRESGVYSGFDS
ncbi:uncharacterized protein LOC131155677 [Malania oleifera]|uniref:uncharacterized protein LOC131155677 n=1 Tax=Malania oleifera TaxID=397392 RepID=UPI0025ADCD00|nr:uncharacterized protein LOC131155677 [Malania oleifera]